MSAKHRKARRDAMSDPYDDIDIFSGPAGQVLVGLSTNANTQLVVYGDGTTDNKPATLYQNNLTVILNE